MADIVGVDGCKAGWVSVQGVRADALRLVVYRTFSELLKHVPKRYSIAVDMPIGLPDRVTGAGRAPEKLVRPMLGARQSSVFSIPARPAVEMGGQMNGKTEDDYPLHRRASALAQSLSDPAKGVSIQAFYLFPKILEIDELLRADNTLQSRVFESHPEVAFTVLNGGNPMREPKKIKGRINPAGMDERRTLLAKFGVTASFLTSKPPTGVGADDVLDAAVCWLVARRIEQSQAISFPDPPDRDAYGLPVAIWV